MTIQELNELIEKFIEYKNLKPNSKRAYITDLKLFNEFYIANKINIETLKKSHIIDWLTTLYNQRAMQRRAVNIRQFLLWLNETQETKLLGEWKSSWHFTPVTPVNSKTPTPITENIIQAIKENYNIHNSLKALIFCILDTGALLEELSQLTWADINLGKLPHLVINSNNKQRIIPITEYTKSLLQEIQSNNDGQDSEAVFIKHDIYEPMNGDYMSSSLRYILHKYFDEEVNVVNLQEYAKLKIRDEQGLEYALNIIGKENPVNLVNASYLKNEELTSDKKKYLRELHKKAFKQYYNS